MHNKSILNPTNTQDLPAGISPSDHNIEFVGVKHNKSVLWFQNGSSNRWEHLPEPIYDACEELFLTDQTAVAFLTKEYNEVADDLNRLVELYIYYLYHDLDSKPDVVNGVLQTCENFREAKDCPSLNFTNKYIDIDGLVLTKRDLQILDDIIEGLPDKMIAHRLGIKIGTFDFHKKNLFKKFNVDSKVSLAVKTLKHNIACAS